jgi:hypothetical protein
MNESTRQADTQTPAQWAVRFFAVASMAAFAGSVPVVHAIWHGALGRTEPMCPTRNYEQMPAATTTHVLEGKWMERAERSLQEDAPLTWHIRSAWNELRYAIGTPRSKDVLVGEDEWFFLAESVSPNLNTWRSGKPARIARLAEVKKLVEAAGAQLVIALVPDKERVHPEKLYSDAQMPPEKIDNFALALAEFAEVKIPAVDLALSMTQARSAHPSATLYHRRDTHWSPAGAFAAATTCAAFLEHLFGDRLGPRLTVAAHPIHSVHMPGDLVGMMGLGTLDFGTQIESTRVQANVPTHETRTVACSPLTHRLSESMEAYAVQCVTPQGNTPINGDDIDAPVWLLGTSFANANGAAALALQLGRPIRWTIRFGASGLGALRVALPELQSKTRAKVIVWEIVERGYFSAEWASPAPLSTPTDGK